MITSATIRKLANAKTLIKQTREELSRISQNDFPELNGIMVTLHSTLSKIEQCSSSLEASGEINGHVTYSRVKK